MSHEVETMAWTGEVPWHGLGFEVSNDLSPRQMLKAAKIDWTVSLQPIAYNGGTPTERYRALMRDSDKKLFDIVGTGWKPTQNEQAFEFFSEYVAAGNATMETAGSLMGGQLVFGLANLGKGFELPGKDVVKGYLKIGIHHKKGKSNVAGVTEVRVVCKNTWDLSEGGGSVFRSTHRMVFNEQVQARAKVELGIAREMIDRHKEDAVKMCRITMSRDDQIEYLAKVFDPELLEEGRTLCIDKVKSGMAGPRLLTAVMALDKAPGAKLKSAAGTMWGSFQAVTYVLDHSFGRTADARLTKSWFGSGARLKRMALQLATKD